MDRLPAGTRIVCPNPACKAEIAMLNRELRIGDLLTAVIFDSLIAEHPIVDGQKAECPLYHSPVMRMVDYGSRNEISTDLG